MSQLNLFQAKLQLNAFWSSEKPFDCPNKRNQLLQMHTKNTVHKDYQKHPTARKHK